MAKFTDKIAILALETALAEFEKITGQQFEIEVAHSKLQGHAGDLEKKIEAMGNNEFDCPASLDTADAIDFAVDAHEMRLEKLKKAHTLAVKKIRLINNVRTRISLKVPLAQESVRQARIALGASFERWTLAQVKDALALLAGSRAVWNSVLAGQLDVDSWCRDLLWDVVPTQKQDSAADSLLKIPVDD